MQFQLITTCQYGKDDPNDHARLIRSVEQQSLRAGDEIALWCLMQGADGQEIGSEFRSTPGTIRYVFTNELISLSKARNKLLAEVSSRPDLFLLFPDDDCWYQQGFFAWLSDRIKESGSDLLFVGNADHPAKVSESAAVFRRATDIDVMRSDNSVNSNTMIISSVLAEGAGAFDERLGPGASGGGGDDTDYAFRVFEISRRPLITSAELIGHRRFARNFRARVDEMTNYWPGIMLQTLKHLRPTLYGLALYRVAVGIYLLLAGRLSVSRFLGPFSEWRRASKPVP